MKGITHFALGAAVVTFFASAMGVVQTEASLIIILGAVCGLLPDTLDFKFMQYIETHDVIIDPHPRDPKPKEIAGKVAEAIDSAGALHPGKMVKVKLHTMRIDATYWRRYSIYFNTRKQEVVVQIGPHVNIVGEAPVPGTEPPPDEAIGTAKFTTKTIDPYGKPSNIAGFSGPSFGFLKRRDGAVEVVFLPWHRRSGHSLTLGALLALIGYLILNLLGNPIAHIYALAIFLPWTLHLLIDQYGHMGNNLFWPLTKQRTSGLGLVSAANPFWNFFAVYSSVAIAFWNMNRFAIADIHRAFDVPLWYYLMFVIIMPWTVIAAAVMIHKAWFEEREPAPIQALGAETGAGIAIGEFGGEVAYDIPGRLVPKFLWMWQILGIGILAFIFVALYVWGPLL